MKEVLHTQGYFAVRFYSKKMMISDPYKGFLSLYVEQVLVNETLGGFRYIQDIRYLCFVIFVELKGM